MTKRNKKIKDKDPRPFLKRHPNWNTFLGFILLIGLLVAAYFLLSFLGKKLIYFIHLLVDATSKLDAVIIVALIIAAVTIISGVVSKIIDFKQKRREYLSQKKRSRMQNLLMFISKCKRKYQKMKFIYLMKCSMTFKNFKRN